jgi:hypothetical protein
MLMPFVFSLAALLLFQALALLGNVAVPRPRVMWLTWLVLGTTVALAGQWGLFPWLASGVLCGYVVRRSLEQGAGLWRATIAGLLPVLIASAVPFVLGSPTEIWTEFQNQVEQLVVAPEQPEEVPSGPEERELIERHRELALKGVRWMLRLFPAEILVFNLFQVLGVVTLAGWMAQRRGEPPTLLPVTEWQVPFRAIWPLVVGLALVSLRSMPLTVLGLNILVVMVAVFAVQGLSVLLSMMGRLSLRTRVLWLGVCALTVPPLLIAFAAVLGTADLWLDFRKLRTASPESP